MNARELIIKAIEIESLSKPDEKIIVGNKIFTYSEFVALLKQKREKEIINNFLNQAEQLFLSNEAFKAKILELVRK